MPIGIQRGPALRCVAGFARKIDVYGLSLRNPTKNVRGAMNCATTNADTLKSRDSDKRGGRHAKSRNQRYE